MNDTVSVVIPAYNEERHLAECLQTLRDQTLRPFEVIVVDDGSRDRTTTIARSAGVHLLRQDHEGPASARNRGARASSGAVMCFLDADMAFAPEFLERLTAPIRAREAISTWSREEFVANAGQRWATLWTLNGGLPAGHRLPPGAPDEAPVFRAIRREPFFAVGGFDDEGYFDDSSVSRKLGIMALPAPGAICYHHNPSTPREVFLAARWIGRSGKAGGLAEVWRLHNPLMSLRNARYLALKHGEPGFFLFRPLFDAGFLLGSLQHRLGSSRAK